MGNKSVIRIEKATTESRFDSRAAHALRALPVFFPKWARIASDVRAYSTDLYWVRVAGEVPTQLIHSLKNDILDDPLCGVTELSSKFPEKTRDGYQWHCLEKSFRTGVTDNAGHVLAEAIELVTRAQAECRSGQRLWLELPAAITHEEICHYADEVFYNNLIERVDVWNVQDARAADRALFELPAFGVVEEAEAGGVETFEIAGTSLPALEKLSEQRLWAFSRDELECVKKYFSALGRAATDVEIEIIAQTWSEHCKHKIFSADIQITNERDDVELPSALSSVFKTYIKGATEKVSAPYLKSVFEDNAGVIAVTRELDCAIKVETHNSPSALDPYGGALTGIVGVNRDILGVGLGAHPIANLDVFCVGPLDSPEALPPRLHHPRRILEGVRTGVEHGGNKSGIPTVTGAVVHHKGYLGKPLVFCGTVGLMPSTRDFIHKTIEPGDRIVMVGGRIGKDGIHGATFSSLEMNENSPVSAVQLGDPLTQRRVWDFLIEARDRGLFRAVTDNGAGGLSSSIGELARMCGKRGGARMDVAMARTKYPGLKPFELVVSESQERMSFAVPPAKLEEFLRLAHVRGVECSDLGEFEDSGNLVIEYKGREVAKLEMEFLHEGLPRLKLKARVTEPRAADVRRYGVWRSREAGSLEQALPAILASPNVCTRRPIVRQYDHEVQARSVRKPYGSPGHAAPGDGATLRLSRTTHEGVALGIGLAPFAAEVDPKVATELAMDEALRNAVVAGMDPAHASLVDNFCWPDPLPGASNPDAEEKLGALVVTCKRVYDGAIELGIPFVSGKDSMKNDYRMGTTKISVPPTLLITAMGKVHDVRTVPRCFARGDECANKRVLWVCGQDATPDARGLPRVVYRRTRKTLAVLHALIREDRIESMHDVSDGGWLVAMAEMLFGTGVSATLKIDEAAKIISRATKDEAPWAPLFSESATSFVLIVRKEHLAAVTVALGTSLVDVGHVSADPNHAAELIVEYGSQRATWKIADLEIAYQGGGHA